MKPNPFLVARQPQAKVRGHIVRSPRLSQPDSSTSDTDAFSYKWKVKGKYVGPFIDIINEVSKRTGYKINLKPLPIKRLIMYIKSGEIDGAIGFRQIESRKKICTLLEYSYCQVPCQSICSYRQ